MPLDFSRIFGAVLLATLAMLSLLVGVGIGLLAKPSQRTNAIIMVFGTGALIQAVAAFCRAGGTCWKSFGTITTTW